MAALAALLFVVLISLVHPGAVTVSGITPDGASLLALRAAVSGDPTGALAGWNASDPTPCHWHGVACNTLPGSAYPRVVSISLSGLNLSGTIPPEFSGNLLSLSGSLDQLRRLSLHHNLFSGPIPSGLFSGAPALRNVLLQSNLFSGRVPPGLGFLSFLQNLDLSGNRLSGPIPDTLAACSQLQHLSLAGNSLSGPIPYGLGGANLTSLQDLDLSDNGLSGPIPPDFGNLTGLQTMLNLSYNRLSGSIPESLGKLQFTVVMDFSHNNLSGKIPQEGSLANQGPGPFIGNPALCGFPLSRPCPAAPPVSSLMPSIPRESSGPTQPIGPFGAQMPASNTTEERARSMGTAAIVAIVVGDAVGILAVGLILMYFYWKTTICKDKCSGCVCNLKKKKKRKHRHGGGASSGDETSDGSSEQSKHGDGSDQWKESEAHHGELVALDKGFTHDLDELLQAAAFVLGKGGLGIVYKVVLGQAHTFAVRRLGEGGSQWYKEFEAEVVAIARVRHPNIVRLRAFYWAPDEKLLIYDFIPNGSLSTALHGQRQSPTQALTWTQRLKIAKGAAIGLAFLHDCSPRKYIHGDVKAAKILLDNEMNAYIADFGLMRLANLTATSMLVPTGTTSSTSSSWHLAATSSSVLYKAPECSDNDAKLTQKCDVYAYGVVLLELISGRSPTFQLVNTDEDLVTWMRHSLVDPLSKFLDPYLLSQVATSSIEKQMVETLHLALACTASSPDLRPKMKVVVDTLDKLSHAFN